MGIAETAASAARNDQFLSVFENFANEFLCIGIENDGSARYDENIVGSASSGAVAAFAVAAIFSILVRVVVERVQ